MTGGGHHGERDAQHGEVAVEVNVEHAGPVLLGAGCEPRGPADAGDVDHGVERTELLDQPGEERADGVLVGDRCG